MKKALILMLGLAASTASFAHLPNAPELVSKSRVVMTTQHKIRLYVQPLSSKGQITIRDDKGHLLYSATVALHKGFSQQFDLADLGTGAYQLTLTAESQTLTKTFVVQAQPSLSYVMQES